MIGEYLELISGYLGLDLLTTISFMSFCLWCVLLIVYLIKG